MASASLRPRPGVVAALFLSAFGIVVALQTRYGLSNDLWDDALFFQRLARNIVNHGVAAWNVADGPVHGSTSQLFQMVAAAVVAVAPRYYHLGIKLVLAACLFGVFATLVRSLRHGPVAREEAERGWEPVAVLFCGLCVPTAQLLIASGMETLVALLVLSLFLLVLLRVRSGAFRSRLAETAVFAGAHMLVYLARPDLVLMTFVASAIALYEPGEKPFRQRRLLQLLLASLVGIALLLVVFRLYYGSAFPLSLYLKTRGFSRYDRQFQNLGVPGERRQLVTWLAFTGPFVYIALFRLRQTTVALLAGAAAFVIYQYVSTIGIMGYHTRFFLPATAPVLLAAAIAWPSFARGNVLAKVVPILLLLPWFLIEGTRNKWIEAWKSDFYLGWLIPEQVIAFAVPTMLLFVLPLFGGVRRHLMGGLVAVAAVAGTAHATRTRIPADLTDEAAIARIAPRMSAMFGLDVIRRCNPEPVHIYHSEIGVPGVMFPESRVTDLSGLMNARLVFGRRRFDSYCLADPPQFLFLPHRLNERLNDEIQGSECILQFTRPRDFPDTNSNLYVRRDLVDAFDACHARM